MKSQRLTNGQVLIGFVIFLMMMGLVGTIDCNSQVDLLAESSQPAGLHSCSEGCAISSSPTHQQGKESSSNHPIDGGCYD